MEEYPSDSLPVFKRSKDRFANPLPHVISKGINLLFNELLQGVNPETTRPILDEIVRLRAVQNFSPSKAVSFIFSLKEILRDHFGGKSDDPANRKDLLTIENEIDKLALISFDIYVRCREKLFEIQVNEIRNQTHMLIRRVNEMDKQNEAR